MGNEGGIREARRRLDVTPEAMRRTASADPLAPCRCCFGMPVGDVNPGSDAVRAVGLATWPLRQRSRA